MSLRDRILAGEAGEEERRGLLAAEADNTRWAEIKARLVRTDTGPTPRRALRVIDPVEGVYIEREVEAHGYAMFSWEERREMLFGHMEEDLRRGYDEAVAKKRAMVASKENSVRGVLPIVNELLASAGLSGSLTIDGYEFPVEVSPGGGLQKKTAFRVGKKP